MKKQTSRIERCEYPGCIREAIFIDSKTNKKYCSVHIGLITEERTPLKQPQITPEPTSSVMVMQPVPESNPNAALSIEEYKIPKPLETKICIVCQENEVPEDLWLECGHPICTECIGGLRKMVCPIDNLPLEGKIMTQAVETQIRRNMAEDQAAEAQIADLRAQITALGANINQYYGASREQLEAVLRSLQAGGVAPPLGRESGSESESEEEEEVSESFIQRRIEQQREEEKKALEQFKRQHEARRRAERDASPYAQPGVPTYIQNIYNGVIAKNKNLSQQDIEQITAIEVAAYEERNKRLEEEKKKFEEERRRKRAELEAEEKRFAERLVQRPPIYIPEPEIGKMLKEPGGEVWEAPVRINLPPPAEVAPNLFPKPSEGRVPSRLNIVSSVNFPTLPSPVEGEVKESIPQEVPEIPRMPHKLYTPMAIPDMKYPQAFNPRATRPPTPAAQAPPPTPVVQTQTPFPTAPRVAPSTQTVFPTTPGVAPSTQTAFPITQPPTQSVQPPPTQSVQPPPTQSVPQSQISTFAFPSSTSPQSQTSLGGLTNIPTFTRTTKTPKASSPPRTTSTLFIPPPNQVIPPVSTLQPPAPASTLQPPASASTLQPPAPIIQPPTPTPVSTLQPPTPSLQSLQSSTSTFQPPSTSTLPTIQESSRRTPTPIDPIFNPATTTYSAPLSPTAIPTFAKRTKSKSPSSPSAKQPTYIPKLTADSPLRAP